MTRRKLITLLGGLLASPVAQPFAARADRTRRIGLLINLRSDDPEGQNRLMAFVQALHQKFGWTEGSNIHIVQRWASPGGNHFDDCSLLDMRHCHDH
jgi:hypothetical protein